MLEITFTHKTLGSWSTTITLSKDMTGGKALDAAAQQYKQTVFSDYTPGHPDMMVNIKGK